jgi:CRISPR-associated protein Cmr6
MKMPRKSDDPEIQDFLPNIAPEGTEVIIKGRNFLGVSRVTFGDKPAQFKIDPARSQITVIVPDGVERGKIKITHPQKTIESSSDFIPMKFPLPRETNVKLKHHSYQCSNLSLLLDRYVGYTDRWEFEEKQKAEFFKQLTQNYPLTQDLVQANYQRWQQMVRTLPHCQTFNAAPEWRMVIGLGQSSILETSMTLNRITGIPIIPGSALKGLAASYAMLCELQMTQRGDAEANPDFKAIFGTQGETGSVIFLDAVPTKVPKLEVDIMNNHHPNYYGDNTGNTPPAPWDSPNPVYFLTLGRESEFAFAIAGRGEGTEIETYVGQAIGWLKAGLSEMGIGAKTAAGYGYMPVK